MRRRKARKLVRNAKMTAVIVAMLSMTVGTTKVFHTEAAEDASPSIENASTEEVPVDIVEAVMEQFETEEYHTMIESRDWGSDDSYLLAKIAMAEAEGEDLEGKALVVLVVLNRVWSDSFPGTIEEVIMQNGQFAPVWNGRYDRVEPNAECFEAVNIVMHGWDESYGALYFANDNGSTWHEKNLEFLFKHGNHSFYTEKEK